MNEKIKAVIVFIAVFGIVGGVSWVFAGTQIAALKTDNLDSLPDSSPNLESYEFVLDLAMNFIKENHPESEQFMNSVIWEGEKQEPLVSEKETTVFNSTNWRAVVSFIMKKNPVYEIEIYYSTTPESGSLSIPFAFKWSGTYTNYKIAEKDFILAQ
ncbi:MAG: hypothetical protein GX638_04320 [Crenarchaeota archaeon]|nr:hypothetical protein [Thermoproteota archaeon]